MESNKIEIAQAIFNFSGNSEPEILERSDWCEENYACTLIAALTSSETEDSYEAHRQQQAMDPDIVWIKQLIATHGDKRPKAPIFA